MQTHSSSRLIVILALLLGHATAAAAQSLDWAKKAGGPCSPQCSNGVDRGSAIAVDGHGNTVVTGPFNGVATFGPGEANETILTSEVRNLDVAKYDVQGSLLWVRQAFGDPQAAAIAVDAAGNSYVAGGFRFGAAFPGVTLFGPVSGVGDLFIAKYDAEGNFVWARQGGDSFIPGLPANGLFALGIAVDGAGNSRVTGVFGTTAGSNGFFAASYDANGSRVWISSAAGDDANPGAALGTGVAADAAGSSYVVGDLAGTVTFGLGGPTQTTLVGSSLFSTDFFIAKYDVNGAFVWAKRTGNFGDDHGTAIAADAAGNVHITGAIDGTVTFGAGEPREVTFTTISNDMFVARYDSGGSLQWARHIPGLGIGGGAAIALDGGGGIHVAGGFVASITFGAGEPTETQLSVSPGGSTNPFVARYNSDGSFAWARSASSDTVAPSGAFAAVALGVAADEVAGSTHITGYFFDFGLASLTFGAGEANETTLTTTFGQEIFVARYTNGTPPANRPPIADAGVDQTVPVGATVTLDGSGSSDPDLDALTYQWVMAVKPPASGAVLQNPTSVSPTFVADVAGAYQVSLVVHDGHTSSAPDLVVVTTANRRPIADAGADQSATTGSTIQLNGTGSSDPDGDALTFAWSFVSRPPQSAAALSNPTSISPSFIADVPGVYVVQLIVSDGPLESVADTVTITVSPPDSSVLGCGTLVSGTIGARGEVDLYSFTGQAGQIISLAIASTAGFASRPGSRSVVLRLISPSGAIVGVLASNSQNVYTLPADGVYSVRVNANNLTTTGSYNISRECLFPVQSPDVVPMPCGGFAAGTIGVPGDTDLFTFTGEAGQIISLAIASSGGFASRPSSGSVVLTLFTPSGTVVGTLASNSQNLFTLPVNGLYSIRVSANNLATTGSYNVSRECLFPVQSPDVVPLSCGGLVAGTISAPGETDLLTFTGQAGQNVSLAIASTQGFASRPSSGSVVLTLFTPAGAVVGTLASNSQNVFTLPVNGLYSIRVSANNLATTGSVHRQEDVPVTVGSETQTIVMGCEIG